MIEKPNGDLVPVETILEEARAAVPDLLKLLQKKTGHTPLVAIAAMEYAAATIVDHTAKCMGLGAGLDQFYDDLAMVREHARKTVDTVPEQPS